MQDSESDESVCAEESNQPSKDNKKTNVNYLFAQILSPANVFAQQLKPRESFAALANVITALIKNNLMTINFVNDQSVKLLRQEWNQVINITLHFTILDVVLSIKYILF